MALVVDTTIKYMNAPEGENFTWSLSKTLNQLTVDDIKSQDAFVGFTSFAVNQLAEGALGQGAPENNPNHCYMWATSSYSFRWNGWDTAHWSSPANYPAGIYMRNILIQRPLNKGGNTSLTNALNDVRIVIDVTPDENTSLQKLAYSEVTNGPFITVWWNNDSSAENRLEGFTYISPATIMIVNDTLYLWTYGGLLWCSTYVNNNLLDQGYSGGITNFNNTGSYHTLAMGWTMTYPPADNILKNVVQDDIYGNGHIDNVDYNGYSGKLNIVLSSSNAQKRMRIGIVDTTANNDIAQMYRAFSGFRWKVNDVWYKPIIQGGVVTGYTDDMTVSSEWDDWTTAKGHNVPEGGGGGETGTDEDEDTAISTVGAPFGTGLAHYYVTTVDSVTLQHISEAMSTWDIDTSKKDLYRNLISCKIIKPPAGIPSTSGVFTIYGVKPQYNGTDITIPEVTGNPSITFGPYSIDRKFNDFRDYAPYSKAEIFIPYCGWTALPSHVIGRSVYVDYFTDVIAGTVKAIIRCNNNAVAEAAGVMAVDIPFAAQNVGAKVAAATTGMLSYGQGALQASVGIGQAVATKGKSGIKNISSGLASVIGAYNQMAMVNNENWTEINGKSGDGCALAGIDTIIIKITRPKYGSYTAPYYVPADYGHTVGFVSMKKTTVGSCTGLIICDNVDTSGISGATDRERQLIKEYLESGVIVKHPE